MTQAELADSMGLKIQQISAIENGRAPMPARHIRTITRVTGLPPRRLIQAVTQDFKQSYLQRAGVDL